MNVCIINVWVIRKSCPRLEGEWCHTFFYPKTKTLNVQGAKQEEVRKKLFSLLSRGNLNIDANEQVLN